MSNGDFEFDRNRNYDEQDFYQDQDKTAEDISGVVNSLSRPRTMLYSILSLICGIASFILCCCGGWFGLGIGALAIAFSIISRHHLGYFDGKSVVGLVLGICGAVFGIAFIVLEYLVESGALNGLLEDFITELDPPVEPSQGGNNLI